SAQVFTGPANWLSVSSNGTAPTNIVVGINLAGLTPGTFTGQINVTPLGSTSSQTIQVTLVVSNTALEVVSPTAVTFTAPVGSTALTQAQTIAVTSTDNSAITYTTTATTTPAGQNWLLLS